MQNNMFPDLRRRLTVLARGKRVSTIPKDSLNTEPQSSRSDSVYFEGRIVKRKRVVLLTPRCQSATCTMCPLPNEAIDVRYRRISKEDLFKQIDLVFRDLDLDTELITLYNNGNFFADSEIPHEVRRHIYERVRDSGVSNLLVESLPQFITAQKLDEAKEILGTKKLTVAIGLQSSSDTIRELAVNTTCTKESFEKAVTLLLERGYGIQAFLMVKPPFVTEEEAIIDVVKSISYLSSMGINDPILCTTRVAPNTVLAIAKRLGHFNPPWIWTVVDSLKMNRLVNPKSNPRIATGELEPEKNPDSECGRNCPKCSEKLIEALEIYNGERKSDPLNDIVCRCREDYEEFSRAEGEKYGQKTIEERVGDFLRDVENEN